MKLIIYSFALAGLLSTAAVAQTPGAPPPPPPHGAPMAKPGEVRYPNIMDAKKALETAKMHLQKAPDIFGGHRAKALEEVDKALGELQEAIKFADEHPKK